MEPRLASDLNFSDRKIPNKNPPSALPSPMASTPSDESRQLEEKSDYEVAVDDVERAQVTKRWAQAMRKYGVEERGLLGCLRSV